MMRTTTVILALFLCACVVQSGWSQKLVILDTDPANDPDDAGCMAMLHGMANDGEVEILAIINVFDHHESPLAISAINYFYNRRAIPVGDYKGPKTDAPSNTYDYYLANTYSRDLASDDDAIEASALYREILASCPDNSVTIIVVGTLHNIEVLLKSEPDVFSPLNGIDLVAEKVAEIVCMGGNFINGKGHDRTNWGGSEKLCEIADWACLNPARNALSRYVIDHSPVPVIASGWENGNGTFAGAQEGNVRAGQRLKEKPEDHVVRRAYEYHFEFRGGSDRINRHTNDQNALLYAVRGAGDYYTLFNDGDITLTSEGECRWSPSPNHGGGYVAKKMDNAELATIIEDLMMIDPKLPDESAPHSPSGLQIKPSGESLVLTWDRASDPTRGSWVVAYKVYRGGEEIATTYGTRFVDPNPPSGSIEYEVSAINVNALESEPSRITN